MSTATLEPLFADILSPANLETILTAHRIPSVYWPQWKALVYDGARPSEGLRYRLTHLANYIGALKAVTTELSKQVLFRFPPKPLKTARCNLCADGRGSPRPFYCALPCSIARRQA